MELVPAGTIDVKADPWQRLVAIGSILSVLFVAVGLYVTNDANREQQRLTAQGQITDRFTKAVEQLGQSGPEKVDVRLGAIYALERIMRDSPADQPRIVNILAAFIRVHTRPSNQLIPTPAVTRTHGDRLRLPVDIQAALTALVHRDTRHDGRRSARPRTTLDLANTTLIGAELTGANLTDADLTSTNLFAASLEAANLTNTRLRYTILTEADLTNANLTNANLTGADLTAAFLTGADLTGADLTNANLTGATLEDADLAGADLRGVDLPRANLTSADLTNTDLTGADLTGADLTGANLTGADPRYLRLLCAQTDDRTRLPAGVARPEPCG